MIRKSNELTIGQVARVAGVSVETVRYYQRRGLLTTPPKTKQGYRYYTSDVVESIRFIRSAQNLGFTLREIGQLLLLLKQQTNDCSEIHHLTKNKVQELEKKFQEIADNRAMMKQLLERCSGDNQVVDCPIVKKLSS